MGKTSAGFWTVLGVMLLGGCAHQPAVKVDNSEQPYRIGREDVLDVAVWRDAELSRTLPVRPDGYISMPMVGEVLAAGKTPTELAEALKSSFQPYVQEPRVTVIVREVNSSRVFVTGEVTHPGAYPLRGRVSLIQAIALAGGFTDFANSDGIVVIRSDGNGGQIPVRYSDLISPDGNQDVMLRPGDTIVVP
ncbi:MULTISPECIES: polysaccharide biosynthesis/export family protein [Myxococcus]|uniref:Sugar ABC transporter substrate-binding protein n=1 Tax=Myxococcus llanfairpwllgwyngyllgogerychwyrndrobwllllantysiliogogogochensis TaxID=2590453 RepID=A0A540WVE6_9BACT|nr:MULTISPECIES: polysaccharide biosynthesis/export family protein [Myxococcus]NTX07960.1 polysaccharide biosynthesis/export family protein [Myxococcus sp. CA040A]TQF12988.1 sugar ABC transporter substrate-binding protein [Myxococcus llanfairpwllgwyngyllgogerychwyrndrobwllllantysiliogogogochensis]